MFWERNLFLLKNILNFQSIAPKFILVRSSFEGETQNFHPKTFKVLFYKKVFFWKKGGETVVGYESEGLQSGGADSFV